VAMYNPSGVKGLIVYGPGNILTRQSVLNWLYRS
jgi:hypothetical protein